VRGATSKKKGQTESDDAPDLHRQSMVCAPSVIGAWADLSEGNSKSPTGSALRAVFLSALFPRTWPFDRDMHDLSVSNLKREIPDKAMTNLILLFALYLSAYLVGLTPAVPETYGLAITVLVIVNVGFLANGLERDR
jgi:hypothetical protein